MDSIEELLLLSGSLIVLAVILVFVLPNINGFAGLYKGQAIATIILNSFKLGNPIVSSGHAIIYDNGYPTTLLVSVTPYNSITGQALGNALSYVKDFVSGPNTIQLPVVSGNAYYKISLYSSDGSVLYTTFYVNQYSSNYVEISNLLSYVKTYLDGTLINLQQTNSTAYLYLPDGTYSLNIYSPYYFYNYNFGFPQNTSEIISLPTSFTQYTIPVYQMLPGKNLQPLPGAIISLNNNSATYKTSSSGTATILYTANAPVEISVTCPPNICGTGITNNYTSFYNVSPISRYASGTTTPIILYPLYRTIFNEQIICNGTAYPTPGTITILANPINQTMNRYGTVNASGQFITYLYAGNYNVTGSTLSGIFNKTTVTITKQNQTFYLNFTYCVVHIPANSIVFQESGLPSNTLWSVTYGSVYNQSRTSTITFNGLLNENYTFSIPNVTVGSLTYEPSPSSGSSYPGKLINVKFTPVIYYVPITLTNSQSSPTPAPFQQMITVDSDNYAKYEASGLQNVEFSTAPGGQGTVLNAWIESGASNTSTSTVYWVNLPSGISAGGSNTIYMNFMPYNVMSSNGPTGEAPQLSSTYAQYDDGASVFNFYDNFAGTTLSSKWVSGASGGTATINNGLSLIVPATVGDYVYVASASAIATQPVIVEAYMNGNSIDVAGYRLGFGLVPSQTYLLADSVSQDHVSWQGTENAVTEIVMATQIGTSYTLPGGVNPVDSNYHIWGIEWLSGEAGWWYNGYSPITTTTSDVPTDTNYLTLSYYAWSGLSGTPTSLEFQWVRTRAYPPNGVMPSVSIGSLQHT